jgi:transglutaminase-like putative cysteine protease
MTRPIGPPARYWIDHLTACDYGGASVAQSWQMARLTPRPLPWQRLLWHRLTVDPVPDERHDGVDGWGNPTVRLGLHRPHGRLSVRMRCEVVVGDRPGAEAVQAASLSWEAVRERVRADPRADDLMPARLCEPSALVPVLEVARHYAASALRPGRPWLEAVTALMRAIHRDFAFQSGVTTTTTSVAEVLQRRRGVCQDFAHVMLACLRSHGLPARYVSGYLLTDPPPGQPRLLGADASHAWVAAWHPAGGWVEFDPTNDQRADRRYVTLAWGADFADVVPLRGVILGGGGQSLQVSVSVLPVDPQAPVDEPGPVDAVPGHARAAR